MPYTSTTTHEETRIIAAIVERARGINDDIDGLTLFMDIERVHAHIPLALEKWLEADASNFAHDVGGIMHHNDRLTGKLTQFFVPRFAQMYHTPASRQE